MCGCPTFELIVAVIVINSIVTTQDPSQKALGVTFEFVLLEIQGL